ncbi:hypothetical protein QZH41_010267, partial [Actinostola sp. cb2023]
MAKKEHRKHVRDLLATAIIHKALDMERQRQYEIRKRLDEIYKVELVRKVKIEGGQETAMNTYLKDDDDPNSPYARAYPGTYPVPAPPPMGTPRRTRPSTSTAVRRKTRPHRFHYLARTEPAVAHRVQLQSMAEVTMKFQGPSLTLTNSMFPEDRLCEVMVLQQHCGGSTLCVFRELLPPNTIFTFISRRHRGSPFGLTFYIDSLQDIRLSACCEYKHKPGHILGDRNGHFQFIQVEGAAPCYRCQIASGVRSPKQNHNGEQEGEEDGSKTFLTQDEEDNQSFDVIITKVDPSNTDQQDSSDKVDDSTQTHDKGNDTETKDEEKEKTEESTAEDENKEKDKTKDEKYDDEEFEDEDDNEQQKDNAEEEKKENDKEESKTEKDETPTKTDNYNDDFDSEHEESAKESDNEEQTKDSSDSSSDSSSDEDEVQDETENKQEMKKETKEDIEPAEDVEDETEDKQVGLSMYIQIVATPGRTELTLMLANHASRDEKQQGQLHPVVFKFIDRFTYHYHYHLYFFGGGFAHGPVVLDGKLGITFGGNRAIAAGTKHCGDQHPFAVGWTFGYNYKDKFHRRTGGPSWSSRNNLTMAISDKYRTKSYTCGRYYAYGFGNRHSCVVFFSQFRYARGCLPQVRLHRVKRQRALNSPKSSAIRGMQGVALPPLRSAASVTPVAPVLEENKEKSGSDSDSEMKPRSRTVSFEEEVKIIDNQVSDDEDTPTEIAEVHEVDADNATSSKEPDQQTVDKASDVPEGSTEEPSADDVDTTNDNDASNQDDNREKHEDTKTEDESKKESTRTDIEDSVDAKPDDSLEVVSPEPVDTDSSSDSSSSSSSDSDDDKDEPDHDPGNDPDLVAENKLPDQALQVIAVEPGEKHDGSIQPLIEGKKDIELTSLLLDPDQVEELIAIIDKKNDVGSVTLRNTGISDDSVQKLVQVLKNCDNIKMLNLNVNKIGADGAQHIANLVKESKSLRMLLNIKDEEAVIIAEGIKENKGLRSLDLEGNKIGDEGGKSLLEAIQVNPTIVDLTLMPMNEISKDIYDEIKAILEERSSSRISSATGSIRSQQFTKDKQTKQPTEVDDMEAAKDETPSEAIKQHESQQQITQDDMSKSEDEPMNEVTDDVDTTQELPKKNLLKKHKRYLTRQPPKKNLLKKHKRYLTRQLPKKNLLKKHKRYPTQQPPKKILLKKHKRYPTRPPPKKNLLKKHK